MHIRALSRTRSSQLRQGRRMRVSALIADDDLGRVFSAAFHVLTDRTAGHSAFVVRARVGVALDLLLAVLAPLEAVFDAVVLIHHQHLAVGCAAFAGAHSRCLQRRQLRPRGRALQRRLARCVSLMLQSRRAAPVVQCGKQRHRRRAVVVRRAHTPALGVTAVRGRGVQRRPPGRAAAVRLHLYLGGVRSERIQPRRGAPGQQLSGGVTSAAQTHAVFARRPLHVASPRSRRVKGLRLVEARVVEAGVFAVFVVHVIGARVARSLHCVRDQRHALWSTRSPRHRWRDLHRRRGRVVGFPFGTEARRLACRWRWVAVRALVLCRQNCPSCAALDNLLSAATLVAALVV
mmetsp:Transcript_9886/g.29887  ORF Transcript_9886/g.29887 Transcript_9886/m.29887 type:complete len:347 (+) Transcript_9886:501-1541(+)